MTDCAGAAALLRDWDRILVMSHASPDGDTLGSASALLRGLVSLGKQVDFYCADPVPEKFAYLFEGLPLGGFAPDHVMTVDVADKKLLGKEAPPELTGRVELAVDHHGTHVPFAGERWVEADSAATTELIYLLLQELGVKVDREMAACLYTGLTTDTGCFRYRSVTPRTHRIAAALLELGAPAGDINQRMFESKSKGQVEAERLAMDSLRFSWGGMVAVVQVPYSIFGQTGVTESDLDAIASMPREIQGVVLGVTLKEKEDGKVKVSVRANPPADASAVCARFGGGGHQGAAGCSLGQVSLDQACSIMEEACGAYLAQLGLCE
ncbi:MAG: DHH family phosphoesterase [Acutalibacter sp.]|jgi:phosphoesterase RecJ-like protein